MEKFTVEEERKNPDKADFQTDQKMSEKISVSAFSTQEKKNTV